MGDGGVIIQTAIFRPQHCNISHRIHNIQIGSEPGRRKKVSQLPGVRNSVRNNFLNLHFIYIKYFSVNDIFIKNFDM